jgi:hypothetical protein
MTFKMPELEYTHFSSEKQIISAFSAAAFACK